MAERTPMVKVDGYWRELPAGDTTAGASGGSRTDVTSSDATVSPTISDSGKQYRLTNAAPTFDISGVTSPVIGNTVFYVSSSTGDVTIYADTDTVECLNWNGGAVAAYSGNSALMFALQLIEVRYTATDTWTLSGVRNGA